MICHLFILWGGSRSCKSHGNSTRPKWSQSQKQGTASCLICLTWRLATPDTAWQRLHKHWIPPALTEETLCATGRHITHSRHGINRLLGGPAARFSGGENNFRRVPVCCRKSFPKLNMPAAVCLHINLPSSVCSALQLFISLQRCCSFLQSPAPHIHPLLFPVVLLLVPVSSASFAVFQIDLPGPFNFLTDCHVEKLTGTGAIAGWSLSGWMVACWFTFAVNL